ncbi:cytochrome P450 2J5-like [Acanthaster planci]|uniref:Cytochrome P450 2J5-like n=1 Tax=Acanthaster planci TaxID=133434 RepID=A0A8B7XWR2_ACAPL|nr:cytochrome P450 2J5-like [Acanthaster planci]
MESTLQYIFEQMLNRNVAVLLAMSLFVAYSMWKSKVNLPPGPWGLPYFGLVPYFILMDLIYGLQRHEALARVAVKYGKVFSFKAFGRVVIVLNDAEAIKEAYQRKEMNDRPRMNIKNHSLGKGVAFASGDCWREQRSFTIRTLETLGAGRPIHEEKIAQEVKAVLDEIAAFGGKAFDPKYPMMICVSNIISSLLFSIRHEYDDKEYKDFLDMIAEITHLMGTSGAINSAPLIKHLPLASKNKLAKFGTTELRYMIGIVKEHRKNLDPENPKDFTDAYLSEVLARKESGNTKSQISYENLPHTLIHLYSAGTENVSTTLRWALLYMIAYPEIQARVQAELDRVVGPDRMPQLSDEAGLPYTQATLLELQRVATVAPLGAAHMSTDEFSLYGYTIPAKTAVIPNTWAIHYNPKVWKEPAKFNPERFLSESGSVIGGDGIVSFSAGNRICIGRHLARMEMYLLFSHLLHRFSFRKADISPPLCFRGQGSFARVPDHFLLQATERHHEVRA